jgi:hypothetical protein
VFFAYLVDPADGEAVLRREAGGYRRRLAALLEWAEAAIDQIRTWSPTP